MSIETEIGFEPAILETRNLASAIKRRYQQIGLEKEYTDQVTATPDPTLAEHRFVWVDDTKEVMTGYIPYLVTATGDHTDFILQKETDSLEDLATKIVSTHPEFALIDAELKGHLRGSDLIPLIRAKDPSIKCIGFSSIHKDVMHEFMEKGAVGSVPKLGPMDMVIRNLSDFVKSQSIIN